MTAMLVLGIESSCDETAAAVIEGGRIIRSNIIASQVAIHAPYGGVVPELASREHLDRIAPVVTSALEDAGIQISQIDGIAVTQGPGLIGSLLVGISFAKSVAMVTNKPIVGVNHIEGHIYSVNFENSSVEYPAVALIVSGGHTTLFLIPEEGQYAVLGRTRDDAAGEAFDKVAKLLGLGYPGGPVIDRLSAHGNPRAVKFGLTQIKHPNRGTPKDAQTTHDFSFSGIKTAVLRYVQTEGLSGSIHARREALALMAKPGVEDLLPLCDQKTLDLIASFQRTVV